MNEKKKNFFNPITNEKPFSLVIETTQPNQVLKFPIQAGVGDYYLNIDWGDGFNDIVLHAENANNSHNYVNAGTYNILIYPDSFFKTIDFVFYSAGPFLKKILSWGNLQSYQLGDKEGNLLFRSTPNLDQLPNEGEPLNTQPELIGYVAMLQGCSSLLSVPNMDQWNFYGALNAMMVNINPLFDFVPFINADFSNVTNLTSITNRFSTSVYSQYLINLANHNSLQLNVPLSVFSTKYDASASQSRQFLIDNYNFSITDGGLL